MPYPPLTLDRNESTALLIHESSVAEAFEAKILDAHSSRVFADTLEKCFIA